MLVGGVSGVIGVRQELAVCGAHGHRVDHKPTTIVELQDDELEQIAGTIGAELQCAARLVVASLEGVAGERVRSGVDDVVVRDAVLASRAVQFHTARL